MKKLLASLVLMLVLGCSTPLKVIDSPIVFEQQRLALTRQYMEDRYGLATEAGEIQPRMIVLHWTAIPSFKKSFEAFNPQELPGTRPDIKSAGQLNVSAHFLVDRDGTIHRLMPEDRMARHTIGLNHCAIGIENVGGTTDTPLTPAQLRANEQLVRYLKEKYPQISYLIGHYEYTYFEDHPLWLEVDDAYRTEKTDPGKDFMKDIRKRTRDLQFEERPTPKYSIIDED